MWLNVNIAFNIALLSVSTFSAILSSHEYPRWWKLTGSGDNFFCKYYRRSKYKAGLNTK